MKKTMMIAFASAVFAFGFIGCKKEKPDNTVKVGLLHSLTGTMSISEVPLRDAELMAINEINAAGGVLGKQIIPVQEDGESDPDVFARKAEILLGDEKVATVFGCWTSDSRKAVKDIFEERYGLLWYPVQYEGIEASPNIMYMGAAPNQQVVPAIDYCAEHFGKRFFLVGSDYVFPRTANKIINAQLKDIGGVCVGEEYVELGHKNFWSIIEEIKKARPDVIVNTLNGDSNITFFRQLRESNVTPDEIPVMSFSIAEAEVDDIGAENIAGNLVTWNYYQTTATPENDRFVRAYKDTYGETQKTGDPIEAAYIAVHLWAMACEKAGTFEVEPVRIAAKGLSFQAPEGTVTIDGGNQHLSKTIRIGKINEDGTIDEIWASKEAVKPDPYLSTYAWARGL